MGNVEKLLEMLPEGYEEAAKETGAYKRKREIETVADLLKLVAQVDFSPSWRRY